MLKSFLQQKVRLDLPSLFSPSLSVSPSLSLSFFLSLSLSLPLLFSFSVILYYNIITKSFRSIVVDEELHCPVKVDAFQHVHRGLIDTFFSKHPVLPSVQTRLLFVCFCFFFLSINFIPHIKEECIFLLSVLNAGVVYLLRMLFRRSSSFPCDEFQPGFLPFFLVRGM